MSTRFLGYLLAGLLVLGAPLTMGEQTSQPTAVLGACDHETKECDPVDFSVVGINRITSGALSPVERAASREDQMEVLNFSDDVRFRFHERNKDLHAAAMLLAEAGFHIAAWTSLDPQGNITLHYEASYNASAMAKLWHPAGKEQTRQEAQGGANETRSMPASSQGNESTHDPAVPCADPRGCPDLIVDITKLMLEKAVVSQTFSPTDCNVLEGSTEAGTRSLLRFTFSSPNIGDGDLVVGAPSHNPDWFEWGDCHGHWHFKEYADYRLWTPEGYVQWQAARAQNPNMLADDVLAQNPDLQDELVSGHKQGFCVIDIDWWHPLAAQKYTSCSHNQGISMGWMDVYYLSLDGQFVDVTDLPLGAYVLETEVNPQRFYEEKDYSNNSAAVLVQLGSAQLPPVTIPPQLPPILP